MARTKTVSTIPYQKNGYDLKIALKLVTEDAGYRGSVPTLSYRIDLESPAPIHLTGTDPQALAKQIIAELDKVCSVTWEPWLLVRTKSGSDRHDHHSEPGWNSEIKLEVQYVFVGTNTEGQHQHVHYSGADGPDIRQLESRHNWKRPGLPRTGYEPAPWQRRDEEGRLDLGCNRALIPDTPENRAKLKTITDAITSIGTQIAAVLSPEKIVGTLAEARFPLLQGPPQ